MSTFGRFATECLHPVGLKQCAQDRGEFLRRGEHTWKRVLLAKLLIPSSALNFGTFVGPRGKVRVVDRPGVLLDGMLKQKIANEIDVLNLEPLQFRALVFN